MEIREFFAEVLPAAFEGYEPREGQKLMALAVERAVEGKTHAVVEAPCGTGKSVAAVAPAVLAAVHGERRRAVVVATANIGLQGQYVGKDLPQLRALLEPHGLGFSFAIAKGIGNYLCLRDLADSDEAGLPMAEAQQYREIERWATSTARGDLEELPFTPTPAVRLRVTTDSEECTGRACPRKDECFALRARQEYKRADVIVTNYHLLFLDAVIGGGGGEGLLPSYDVLVMDEAHKAGDIAREYFGFQVTRGGVLRAVRLLAPRAGRQRLPTLDAELHARVRAEVDELWDSLAVLRRSRAYRARLRAPGLVKSERLEALLQEAAGLFAQQAKETADREYRARLEKATNRCEVIRIQLRAARELAQPGEQVYHLDQQTGGGITLASKLIDVAPVLREKFWSKLGTVVATSATLCDGRGSFDLVDRDIGVPPEAERLQVESPFDHARCLVVVPEGMPDPRSEAFAAAVGEKLLRTVTLAGGRTLALFTSYRVMEAAYQRLARARLPFAVMKQKDAPRMELVRRFKSDETSVLLGTESFWAGVDVPGPSLSVVFIDKLPFVTPEDPVVDAVAEADPKGWFHRWSLPRAVVQLRQGAGRLMRARSDYGAVVICDPRVTTAAYGGRFLEGFPEGVQVTTDLEEVGAWLTEHAEVA